MEAEVTKELVVANKLTSTLVDLHLNSGLAIDGSEELFGGDGSVPGYESGHNIAEGFDAQREGLLRRGGGCR